MTPEDKALVDTIRQRANADQAVDDAEKAHICTTRDVSYTDANAMTEAFRDCCSVRLIGIDGKVRGTTSRQCTRLECPQCEDTISTLKGDRAIALRIIDEQYNEIMRLEKVISEERNALISFYEDHIDGYDVVHELARAGEHCK